MLSYQDLLRYMEQLSQKINQQHEQIDKLLETVNQLQSAIEELNERPAGSHIERVEYNFEQLKIEQLQGTLNIGLTPYASGNIEQMSTEGKQESDVSIGGQEGPEFEQLFREVRRRIDEYLQTEAPKMVEELEQRHQVIFGAQYRELMLKDINRQLDERIRHYLSQEDVKDRGEEDRREIADRVFAKTVQDIRTALEQYFQSMPRQRE